MSERRLLTGIVRPVLAHLAAARPELGGRAAEEITLGTLIQGADATGAGRALGPGQFLLVMAEAVAPHGLLPLVQRWSIGTPDCAQLAGNLWLSATLARLIYLREATGLPPAGDAVAQAEAWARQHGAPPEAVPGAVMRFARAITLVRWTA